jgi:hypothetical protein
VYKYPQSMGSMTFFCCTYQAILLIDIPFFIYSTRSEHHSHKEEPPHFDYFNDNEVHQSHTHDASSAKHPNRRLSSNVLPRRLRSISSDQGLLRCNRGRFSLLQRARLFMRKPSWPRCPSSLERSFRALLWDSWLRLQVLQWRLRA